MARPPWEPSAQELELIEAMSRAGITHEQISKVLKKDVKTLKKYCGEILENSKHLANSKVAGWLFNNCEKGNVTAQIFWMKTRGGWRETSGDDEVKIKAKDNKIEFVISKKPDDNQS